MARESLLSITLSPVLIAQALQVGARTQRLPEPPGPRQGRVGEGPELRLLILGDSSAAGVGATHQGQALAGCLVAILARRYRLTWQLEARSGATTATALTRLGAVAPETRADVAIVALGVNDATRAAPTGRWIARQKALHELLRHRFGARLILRSGLPPMGHFPLLPQPLRWTLGKTARRLDIALAGLCADAPDLCHVPLDLPFAPEFMASDGFHPSEPAYAKWADLLAPHVLI